MGCLIELKLWEVSWNSFSNWFWKFQLSILRNKKVLFLKNIFFKQFSISKQKRCVYWHNFPEGFVETETNNSMKMHPIIVDILWACNWSSTQSNSSKNHEQIWTCFYYFNLYIKLIPFDSLRFLKWNIRTTFFCLTFWKFW